MTSIRDVLLWSVVFTGLLAGCSQKTPSEHIASAKSFIGKNEPKSAVVELKSALQADPQQAEARFLLGSLLLEAGDTRSALLELRKAQDLKYSNDAIVPLLVRAMLGEWQYREVIDRYGSAVLANPLSQGALKTGLANAYLRLGKRAEAEAALRSALESAPGLPAALLIQARLKLGSGDGKAALAIVDQALTADARNLDAWLLLGDLRTFVNADEKGALDAYRRAIELQSANVQAHIGAISLLLKQRDVEATSKQLERMKAALPGHPQTRFFEAQVAYLREDFRAARELTLQLLKVAPNSALLLQLAGAIELQIGSVLQAETYLAKSLVEVPDLTTTRTLLARAHLRSGRPAKALAVLQPILETNAPGSEVLALAAEASLQAGDIDRADNYFVQAAKVKPNDSMLRASLALMQIAKGNVEAGFSALQSIATNDAGTHVDMAMVTSRIKRREYDAALEAIQGLERKLPKSALPSGLRGRIELLRQNPAAARPHFERALALDDKYFPAVASLAALDAERGAIDAAKKRLEAYVAREPTRSDAWLALAGLVNRGGRGKVDALEVLKRAVVAAPASMEVRTMMVEQLLAQPDNAAALAMAQETLAAFPNQPAVLDLMGRAQFAVGDKLQALKTFSTMSTLQPSSPLPFMRLADVYLATGALPQAIASVERALDVAPTSRVALSSLISLSIRAKQPERALSAAEALKKRQPDDAMAYVMEGDVRSSRKEWDKALAAFRTGTTKANPELASIRLHATLLQVKRVVEANQFAQDWMQRHRHDERFAMHLGEVALSVKDYPEAERRYRDVLKIRADHAAALNNLAWALLKQRKSEALSVAERAVQLSPGQREFVDTLASAQAEAGQFDRAVETQAALVQQWPRINTYRLNLAKYLVRAGRGSQAREHLQILSKLGTKFGESDEVEAMLKSLGS